MNVQGRSLYTASIWSLALFLLAAGSALVITMLANVIGPFRFTALDESHRSRSVGFWIPADENLPYPPEIKRRTAAWRRFIGDDDIVVESNRLRDLLNAGVGVVVLPDARRIDAEHAEAIHRYMLDGGGIIVTGSIGVRDAENRWLGYEVMGDLLQVPSIMPLPREQSDVVRAGQRGPIAARLDPGLHFEVISEPGVPALEGRDSELLWSGAADAGGSHATASRRIRLGLGRLAWIGPGPEVIDEGDLADRGALESTLANALAWVRRKPILEVAPWSNGAAYAVVIDMRVDPRASGFDDRDRFAIEDQAMATIERAARTSESVQIEIPIRGPGDTWAEALRIRLMERIGADAGWSTTRMEIDDWRAARAGLNVAVTRAGPNRLLVNVSNRGEMGVSGVGLRLWINRPAASIQTAAINLGQEAPRVRFDRASEAAEISLPDLAAGSNVAFYVDLDDPDFDEVASVRSP